MRNNDSRAIPVPMIFFRGVACIVISSFLLSCAFGKEDAVQSLFETDKDTLVVAVGTGTIRSSLEGTLWSANLINNPAAIVNCVMYAAGKFVAAGDSIYVSEDGLLWVRGMGGIAPAATGAAYFNKHFIGLGGNSIVVSQDALFWGTVYNSAGDTFNDVCRGGNRAVVVSSSGNAYVSFDGLVWAGPVPTGAMVLYKIAYGNGLFVAVGNVGGPGGVALSADGLVWTKVTISEPANHVVSIAFGNGRFVASDMSGTIHLSNDGLAWVKIPYGVSMRSITYCSGKFIGVGSGGMYLISTDGLSWQTHSMQGAPDLFGIACRP
jgi:hypothetical protein